MTTRSVLKYGSAWTTVSDHPDEASYRFPSRKAAEAHIAKLEREEVFYAQLAAERAADRLARVLDYLAARKVREAARPKQIAFDF